MKTDTLNEAIDKIAKIKGIDLCTAATRSRQESTKINLSGFRVSRLLSDGG